MAFCTIDSLAPREDTARSRAWETPMDSALSTPSFGVIVLLVLILALVILAVISIRS
jgi:hypothetical protein